MSEKQNTWNQLLSNKLQTNNTIYKNLLFLGPKSSGKRTLVNCLHKMTQFQISQKYSDFDYKLGDQNLCSAIDYTYFSIKQEDFKAKINIYLMDNPNSKDILQIYEDDFLQKLVVCIILDYNYPQNFIFELDSWIESLQDLIINMKIPYKEYNDMKEKLKLIWQNYQEPQFDEENNLIKKEKITKSVVMTQGILEQNFGFPIIIVQAKGDMVEQIQREKDGEEKINYIQSTLRNYSLQYGAGLITVSCKNQNNIDIFYEYLMHLLVDLPLKTKADITQNGFFIPIGYDSQQLIQQTYSNLQTNKFYPHFFQKENQKNQSVPEEFIIEDNDTFLQKFKEKLGGVQKQNLVQDFSSVKSSNESQDAVKSFYANLKNKPQKQSVFDPNLIDKKKREKAEEDLRQMSKSGFEDNKN